MKKKKSYAHHKIAPIQSFTLLFLLPTTFMTLPCIPCFTKPTVACLGTMTFGKQNTEQVYVNRVNALCGEGIGA
jgi:hypothetical protein